MKRTISRSSEKSQESLKKKKKRLEASACGKCIMATMTNAAVVRSKTAT